MPAQQPSSGGSGTRTEVGSGERRHRARRNDSTPQLDIERLVKIAKELGAQGVRIKGAAITITLQSEYVFHVFQTTSQRAVLSSYSTYSERIPRIPWNTRSKNGRIPYKIFFAPRIQTVGMHLCTCEVAGPAAADRLVTSA